MSTQTLITALALSGFMLGGCEKPATDDVDQTREREAREREAQDRERQQVAVEPPVLPQEQREAAKQQQPEPTQRAGTESAAQPSDLEVLPAVTVIGIEFECIATDVFFPTASAELDADDKAALDNLAACLKGTKQKEQVEITASTDPRGSERYNEALSRERAEAVAQYLQQQGVKERSFEIRARGEKGVVEGVPMLWPLQREATVEPKPPVSP